MIRVSFNEIRNTIRELTESQLWDILRKTRANTEFSSCRIAYAKEALRERGHNIA
jgi:hypothetical protein